MNLLDENIPSEQAELLKARGIRCRSIGQDYASLGILDENVITLLHRLKQPTFFTRDRDFFKVELCHGRYSLVWLDVAPEETALYVRRYLRHPRFKTKNLRLGTVARVHHDGINFWERRNELTEVPWFEVAP